MFYNITKKLQPNCVGPSIGVVNWQGHRFAYAPFVPDLLGITKPPKMEFNFITLGQFNGTPQWDENGKPAEHA